MQPRLLINHRRPPPPGGFAALDTKLALLCDGGGQLEAGELLLALRQCGVGGVSEGDVCALVAEYAGSAPGRVAARVLLAALQQRAAA